MGYLIFAVLFAILVIFAVIFFSKKKVEGSDGGANDTTPDSEKQPNEEFITDDPTHHEK